MPISSALARFSLGRQYIPNHNGLLGRYPGADGMKTGFTCPAGFNVVASANHSGRRLIVVVLGAPSARTRNQEAADLFDRGFASGGGSGSLELLPSGSGPAPNMRADVCLHRNAAALAAAEDDGIADQAQARRLSGTRRDASHPFGGAFCAQSPRTPSSPMKGSASIRCPSTLVPRPGGRGRRSARAGRQPKLPPRRREPRPCPLTDSSTAATTSEGDASGPIQTSPRSKHKPARHSEKSMAAHKPAKSATGKLEKKDVSTN